LFAAITVALISGSIADRAKFGAWMIFAGAWVTLVYFPVAHWVFAFDNFVAKTGGWIANDLGAMTLLEEPPCTSMQALQVWHLL